MYIFPIQVTEKVKSNTQHTVDLVTSRHIQFNCHKNFGLAKILVQEIKIPGKLVPLDQIFLKIVVRAQKKRSGLAFV